MNGRGDVRARDRSSSSTTSAPASSTSGSPSRSWPASRPRARRAVARCSAGRRPSCRACTPPASTIWPASRSASSRARRSSTARASPRATGWSPCRRAACTRTGTRSRGQGRCSTVMNASRRAIGRAELEGADGGRSAPSADAPLREARAARARRRRRVDVKAMSHVTGGGLPGQPAAQSCLEGLGVSRRAALGTGAPDLRAASSAAAERSRERDAAHVQRGRRVFAFVVARSATRRARRSTPLRALGESPIALGRVVGVPQDRPFEEEARLEWAAGDPPNAGAIPRTAVEVGRSSSRAAADQPSRGDPRRHLARGRLDARIALVVSNVADAGATRARARRGSGRGRS